MKNTLTLHVAPAACGKADGSAAHPYATLEAARDALRARRRRGAAGVPVRVLVAPGVYRLQRPLVFTPEDGGTAACPVTWRGEGGRPLLSGARAVSGWREGTINGRPCWQATLPDVAAGRWWFTQLFVNGRRRLRARLPHQGFYRFAGVPADEARKDPGTHFHGAMSALFAPGEVRRFRNLADIEVVVPDHWYENHLRVAAVDEKRRVIRFATKGWSRFSRDETGRHARFRLDHVAEGCTEPGDWYLDRPGGTLSYIPMPGESPDTTLVEAPALDHILAVSGDPLDPARRVRHLRFEFLDLRHADWELPRENPGALQSGFNVPAAVRFVGAEDCAFYGCRVSQVAGWGVEVLRGCHRNRIVACALHDLGGGGVKIGHEGGLPRHWTDRAFRGMDAAALGWGPCREDPGGHLPGRDRAQPSATTVSDCSIHDGGILFHSAIGVWIGDASRNRIVHNAIWNFNYSGISCGWTWGYAPAFTCDNRIEGNHIHGIGHGVLSDMGAIYTLGRQAGSTVSRNFIHDVHSYGYGGWGIYPDEGSSWLRIEENVVCGTKCGGFHQHYGRDNLVRHNLFAEAIENQVQFSRHELVRPGVFVRNVVQGASNGMLCQGGGLDHARFDGNRYVGDPGRPARFGGREWRAWRESGQDRAGGFSDARLLDAAGAVTAAADTATFKAAGIEPSHVAAVVSGAGPRFRGTLPPSLDAVPREPETRRALVESCLWPWPAEWPGTHPWGKMPGAAATVRGEPLTVSLTLENRGDAPARGRYRFKVVPAAAARLHGPAELTVALKPGARAAFEATVTATGKTKAFRIEAAAEGDDLTDSCLFFAVMPRLDVPRLAALPPRAGRMAALASLPPQALDGNGAPAKAVARLAVAGDALLLRVDAADPAPTRGANLWDGSSVELFAAPRCGDPMVQWVIAAPLKGRPAAARRFLPAGKTAAAKPLLDGAVTAEGWTLTLAIPLTALGLDAAAETFALDLAVTVAGADGGAPLRLHLAGEANPARGSDGYAHVAVTHA